MSQHLLDAGVALSDAAESVKEVAAALTQGRLQEAADRLLALGDDLDHASDALQQASGLIGGKKEPKTYPPEKYTQEARDARTLGIVGYGMLQGGDRQVMQWADVKKYAEEHLGFTGNSVASLLEGPSKQGLYRWVTRQKTVIVTDHGVEKFMEAAARQDAANAA